MMRIDGDLNHIHVELRNRWQSTYSEYYSCTVCVMLQNKLTNCSHYYEYANYNSTNLYRYRTPRGLNRIGTGIVILMRMRAASC